MRLKLIAAALFMALAGSANAWAPAAGAATAAPLACTALAGLTITDGTVTSAQEMPADANPSGAPAYCRVQLVLHPEAASNIKVEVWLPQASRWNGKFLGAGSGGAGGLNTGSLRSGIMQGYATANSDLGTGATGLVFAFGIGKPWLVKDFGTRATHGMTIAAKQVIAAYYAKAPTQSYFSGCSTGGHQALAEVQRFPTDYDGVIAGAPANDRTHLHMVMLWGWQILHETPASNIPAAKVPLIMRASIAACDSLDGATDGLISDPSRCKIDPASLRCSAGDRPDCLTDPQVVALGKLYSGPKNPRTGQQIYPGYSPGAEAAILTLGSLLPPSTTMPAKDGVMNWSTQFQAAHPNGDAFDFDQDVQRVDSDLAQLVNFVDPNLSAFSGRGGKLILYHGWADSLIPAQGTVDYYRAVQAAAGGADQAARFARLFMIPGADHCDGVDTNQVLTALAGWVEKGQAPESLASSHPALKSIARLR